MVFPFNISENIQSLNIISNDFYSQPDLLWRLYEGKEKEYSIYTYYVCIAANTNSSTNYENNYLSFFLTQPCR
jgi:hypothetical protein